MSDCQRCGKCCREYAIAMVKNADFARFLTYHGLVVRDRSGHLMEVYGESKCRHLKSESGKPSLMTCAVYEDRPEICREWECERMAEEATPRRPQ